MDTTASAPAREVRILLVHGKIATADRPLADGSNWYSRPEAAIQSEAPVAAKPSLGQR